VHGDKFKLADSSTWESLLPHWSEDPKWGQFRFNTGLGSTSAPKRLISCNCCGLLFLESILGTLPKPMWLGWLGESMPALEQTWRCYLRRFAVDHWNRFAKQRLHWTLPNFSTTKLAERWSDLMPLLNWQLWLARDIVKHPPLPWQKQQTDLTPGRVAQGFAALLAAIGTPPVSLNPEESLLVGPRVSRVRRELATQWLKDYT
jgi:hypothetical protein